MTHDLAKAIFKEIRDRPYAWSLECGVPAHNCYFKGLEILQRIGALGYAVRGRIGEAGFGDLIPQEIQKLHPPEFLLTHFYVEIHLDGRWKILDPSFDSALAPHGFIVNAWEDGRSCFEITRLYSQEDQITYSAQWEDPAYAKRYFEKIKPCALAVNAYLEGLRSGIRTVGP